MKTAPRLLIRAGLAAVLLALVATVACAQTVYVENGNGISKIVSGSATAFTTSAISDPMGLTFGPGGYLYVSANGSSGENVVTVAPDGTVAPFTALSSIHQPIGLTFGFGGNLYVATNNTGAGVEQVTVPGGVVTPFPSTSPFSNATAVAFAAGTLYVADYHDGTISKVSSDGTVSAFASGLIHPYGLAFGPGGVLYVANYGASDGSGQGFISKVDTFGTVSSWAVTGVTFFQPTGLAFDQFGNLFVANHGAGNVLEIAPDGSGSVFASGLTAPGGIAVSAIPEPSTYAALFGLAALGFAAYRRRHRQSA